MGNSAHLGGGLTCDHNSATTLTRCVIAGNTATLSQGGGLYSLEGSTLTLDQCTVAGNMASEGSGIYCVNAVVTATNCIVAFGEGSATTSYSAGTIDLSCCDIYGNSGGDWTGYIADQLGVDGNISEDPLFCDLDAGNLGLSSSSSPCAPHTPPNWECDLIGALPVNCGDWEGITSIADVGQDQGGQVRVRWNAHILDDPDAYYPITEYSLWRRIDRRARERGKPKLKPAGGDDPRYPPGDWEYVLSVPAIAESIYATVCPTLCDSTAEGICWTSLYLIALTEDPSTFFESEPDSGYSADNLSPEAPLNLFAVFANDSTLLSWDASPEEDFAYYSVYRDTFPEFIPGGALGHTTEPSYVDTDLPEAGVYWYKVTSTDFHDNESEASEPAGITTSVPGQDPPPRHFFLGPAVPNPFNPETEIRYGIPQGAAASPVGLRVFDVAGRRVRTLVDEVQGPGNYRVIWNGRDDSGFRVSSGVYFYRITWNGRSESKQMVLLK